MSPSFLLLLLPLCLVFAIPSTLASDVASTPASQSDPQTIKRIEKVCSSTSQPKLCVTALLTYPESQKADLHQLAGLAIRYAANNGVENAVLISAMIMDMQGNAGLQQCLQDCSEKYMDAVDLLDSSTVALDERAYNNVNVWVTAAMDGVKSCTDGCKEMGAGAEGTEEVKKKVDEFVALCNIAHALANHDH